MSLYSFIDLVELKHKFWRLANSSLIALASFLGIGWKVIELNGESVQVEIARAQALLNKKQPNPDKAIKLLKPLLKRNRKSWMLYHYMGVAMLQKADYRKALDYLTQALQEGANEPESYHLVSVAYHNINEFDEAIRYARQALDRKQDFLEAWIPILPKNKQSL